MSRFTLVSFAPCEIHQSFSESKQSMSYARDIICSTTDAVKDLYRGSCDDLLLNCFSTPLEAKKKKGP